MVWSRVLLIFTMNFLTIIECEESTGDVKLICGKHNSTDWDCSMEVDYTNINKILCNNQLDNNKDIRQALKTEPTITAYLSEPIQKGVLIMYDPDVPGSPDHDHGFAHWVTLMSTDDNGAVTINKDKEFLSYFPPTPPPGSGVHRYQFFLFRSNKNILSGADSRGVNLCSFIDVNGLGNPEASFQYQFEQE